ncbi:hypothetical protein [endosymbiont of Ridgeia piscesae]|jgi:hypothetical protein|nr:hypothetical protein [endosymbiont of Ridgeia piscesae]
MAMHTGRLVLTPQDPFFALPTLDGITGHLRQIDFCGERLDQRRFLLGERFLQLISFMGCSPHIELEPTDDDRSFCHLQILPMDQPIFLQGRNTNPPRCGKCRRRIQGWERIMEEWQEQPQDYQATCPHCAHSQNPAHYQWRQTAGSGQLFLYVENIFPQEAQPSTRLLNTLAEASGAPWHYFFIQD